ncbi:MAG: ferritin-like domain-containing protein [Candidatus Manganitrophaceae bacterium]|nr:MAG: ferritin-like domain-containing protein [Candidatus Manganitrophaceae bacterium]
MEMKSLLQMLLADERRLHQAYTAYLPLLRPAVLREKIQRWAGEGWKHIEALERAVEKSGALGETVAPGAVPPSAETHALLDFFYQQEERLYYRYQEALKRTESESLRSLLFSHLQDQKRHLAGIQHLYAEFLYY